MSKPIIGVLPSHDGTRIFLNADYAAAIWEAGGIPVPLHYTNDKALLQIYSETFDAFLLTGGPDIHPAYYGEKIISDTVVVDTDRDQFEFAIFPYLLKSGKPLLGICRGMQFMNIALGGTLYQNIEGHKQSTVPYGMHTQRIKAVKGGYLHSLSGKENLSVNTFHHQAVKDLAPDLLVDAKGSDGTIEAYRSSKHPYLVGVQFHPERYFSAPDDDHALLLFRDFIQTAGKSKE